MSKQTATVAAIAAFSIAATAPSASAYPSSVTNRYTIGTVNGSCTVDVSARAEALPAAVGQLTGAESVNCGSLTVTPYRIYLSGGFSSTSLDPLHLLDAEQPVHICQWQKSCSASRSATWFPPGDHYVNHHVEMDVAPYAVGKTYSSFPSACRVSASDTGRLICDFRQWVTMSPPSAPSP